MEKQQFSPYKITKLDSQCDEESFYCEQHIDLIRLISNAFDTESKCPRIWHFDVVFEDNLRLFHDILPW